MKFNTSLRTSTRECRISTPTRRWRIDQMRPGRSSMSTVIQVIETNLAAPLELLTMRSFTLRRLLVLCKLWVHTSKDSSVVSKSKSLNQSISTTSQLIRMTLLTFPLPIPREETSLQPENVVPRVQFIFGIQTPVSQSVSLVVVELLRVSLLLPSLHVADILLLLINQMTTTWAFSTLTRRKLLFPFPLVLIWFVIFSGLKNKTI